ncbi:MAG: thioredoxin family protein [Planctomycetes bacterium]|nr:thioredoxin family protein [Planctomycetota bacterium]
MKRWTIVLSLLAIVALAVAPWSVLAAKNNKKVEIGQAGPDFKGLKGTDGKERALADYKDAKALVLVFTCNACPVAVAYEDRMIDLQKKYADKGVKLLAINCNTNETLDAMKERATSKNFNFDYLLDAKQQSGRDYGASCTPHIFILDGERKIAYMGSFDDNMNDSKVQKHHVAAALDALLDGKLPVTTETKQFGCGIRYQ